MAALRHSVSHATRRRRAGRRGGLEAGRGQATGTGGRGDGTAGFGQRSTPSRPAMAGAGIGAGVGGVGGTGRRDDGQGRTGSRAAASWTLHGPVWRQLRDLETGRHSFTGGDATAPGAGWLAGSGQREYLQGTRLLPAAGGARARPRRAARAASGTARVPTATLGRARTSTGTCTAPAPGPPGQGPSRPSATARRCSPAGPPPPEAPPARPLRLAVYEYLQHLVQQLLPLQRPSLPLVHLASPACLSPVRVCPSFHPSVHHPTSSPPSRLLSPSAAESSHASASVSVLPRLSAAASRRQRGQSRLAPPAGKPLTARPDLPSGPPPTASCFATALCAVRSGFARPLPAAIHHVGRHVGRPGAQQPRARR